MAALADGVVERWFTEAFRAEPTSWSSACVR